MNVAVIGVGNMGQHHARIYSELPGVTLVGVCDVDKNKAEHLAKSYNCKAFFGVDDLLDKEKRLDGVSIAVPTHLHFAIASIFIEQGIHVLLEKPITSTLDEAEKLVSLARMKQVQLLIGHVERFNPAVVKIKSLIEKEEMGEITSLIARRVGGVPPPIKNIDIATDLAIHDIDIINYILGRTPNEISVNKQKFNSSQYDSVEFFMQYNRTSAYVQANWITPVKIRKLHVTGTKGYIEIDYITQKIEFYKSNKQYFEESSPDFSEYILHFSTPEKQVITVDKKEPLKEEILYFISHMKQKKLLDTRYAIDALRIALA